MLGNFHQLPIRLLAVSLDYPYVAEKQTLELCDDIHTGGLRIARIYLPRTTQRDAGTLLNPVDHSTLFARKLRGPNPPRLQTK